MRVGAGREHTREALGSCVIAKARRSVDDIRSF
jgi:hypothetical protein